MKFRFSGTLLRFVDFNKEIEIENAETLNTAIVSLIGHYPALSKVLYDNQMNLRATHRLFLNGEPVAAENLTQPLKTQDCITFLTAIAGG